jgi:hypothetical protein
MRDVRPPPHIGEIEREEFAVDEIVQPMLAAIGAVDEPVRQPIAGA